MDNSIFTWAATTNDFYDEKKEDRGEKKGIIIDLSGLFGLTRPKYRLFTRQGTILLLNEFISQILSKDSNLSRCFKTNIKRTLFIKLYTELIQNLMERF